MSEPTDGYLLLADGLRLEGRLHGPTEPVVGVVAANTGVVGFQEMATDPAYKGRLLAFTYPEIGNVGAADRFSESADVQVSALLVRVLKGYRSHYLAEEEFGGFLARAGVPCLAEVDTRGLAVHLREEGEMTAAVAPASVDEAELQPLVEEAPPSKWAASPSQTRSAGDRGPELTVLNLGIRRSQLAQLASCCRTQVLAHNADPDAVLERTPDGVFVSDGPGDCVPPEASVETIAALLGRVPILACGLGNVALGMALGCSPAFLKRGHHGANYPVSNLLEGSVEVTQQRHTVVLDRASVETNDRAELLAENMNDESVEGIRSADGQAVGLQAILAAPNPDAVNAYIKRFVDRLAGQ